MDWLSSKVEVMWSLFTKMHFMFVIVVLDFPGSVTAQGVLEAITNFQNNALYSILAQVAVEPPLVYVQRNLDTTGILSSGRYLSELSKKLLVACQNRQLKNVSGQYQLKGKEEPSMCQENSTYEFHLRSLTCGEAVNISCDASALNTVLEEIFVTGELPAGKQYIVSGIDIYSLAGYVIRIEELQDKTIRLVSAGTHVIPIDSPLRIDQLLQPYEIASALDNVKAHLILEVVTFLSHFLTLKPPAPPATTGNVLTTSHITAMVQELAGRHKLRVQPGIQNVRNILHRSKTGLHLVHQFVVKTEMFDLIRLRGFPTLTRTGMYEPFLAHEYMVASKTLNLMAPVSKSEAKHCLENPFKCDIYNSLKEPLAGACGVGNYFGKLEICKYKRCEGITVNVLIVSNTLIAVSPLNITVRSKCIPKSNAFRDYNIGQRGYMAITGQCRLQVLQINDTTYAAETVSSWTGAFGPIVYKEDSVRNVLPDATMVELPEGCIEHHLVILYLPVVMILGILATTVGFIVGYKWNSRERKNTLTEASQIDLGGTVEFDHDAVIYNATQHYVQVRNQY